MATINILPVLDLAIADSYNDMNSISIVDLSLYATLPDSSDVSLEITPPQWPTLNVPFSPGMNNVYHCSDIGIICGEVADCCPLPDGVYNIRYTVRVNPMIASTTLANATMIATNLVSGPFTIDKAFLRVDTIRCKWMNAFLKVDLECNCSDPDQKQYKEELRRIDLLINGSIAAANNCDNALSARLYDKANKMLNNLCCKFNMPCSEVTCNTCGCH